ncbi:alpha/beta fold hydrolase [Christiangramia aquimixticola]|uniref:alpha/beta fold hydrolase n=1 Tax=Christiangramia aquimixticola TaxID=1697558 RepID=UPI003AA91E79
MDKYVETKVEEVIKTHEASGKYLDVDGIRTFYLDRGKGETVICIHGVPTSSFLYRKVLKSLEQRGMRGISIDLPGLGLSDRPENFDYDFYNFARHLKRTLQELNIEKYHLVVHDIGGPIGFALAAENKENILSLTILNTMIDIQHFKKPLVMRPFEKKILGEAELKSITHQTWPVMFSQMGVNSAKLIPSEDIKAYVDLLKSEDNGKAFLKIMRNFNQTESFQKLCFRALNNVPYPIQAVWGEDDPALTFEHFKRELMELTDVEEIHLLDSKHLLQEEVPDEIAEKIYEFSQKKNGS